MVCLQNMGYLTSHNPMDLHSLLQTALPLPHFSFWSFNNDININIGFHIDFT
jgi:hypothetical protein